MAHIGCRRGCGLELGGGGVRAVKNMKIFPCLDAICYIKYISKDCAIDLNSATGQCVCRVIILIVCITCFNSRTRT